MTSPRPQCRLGDEAGSHLVAGLVATPSQSLNQIPFVRPPAAVTPSKTAWTFLCEEPA